MLQAVVVLVSRAVAAIRMPMLRVSNFKGGTPELVETSYAVLVLVLPAANNRVWSYHEMEIVDVVADLAAVALSRRKWVITHKTRTI